MPAMASAGGLTDSYIMLTPTSAGDSARSAPASDLLARKWAAAAKRKLSREASREILKAPEPEADNTADSSPTETDRSSEIGNNERPSTDGAGSDQAEEDSNDELEVFPTYVCELHDPKPLLVAEQVPYNRVDIVAHGPPPPPAATAKDRKRASSNTAYHGYSDSSASLAKFQYEISVGPAQQVFTCSPSKVLEVFKALSRDKNTAAQLRFIETNCLKDGLMGSLKRMYATPAQLAGEVMEVLEAISDVDAVLVHPAYLSLIGASKDSTLCREIDNLLQSHSKTPRSDPSSSCMCDVYYKSIQRFGEFYREQAQAAAGDQGRQSTVASESLMWSRGVLSFYTDTIYLLDKREFRPTHGLKKCTVYGFGRRKLFEIVRVSRKQWSVRHVSYGQLYTLSIEKYARGVNSHHMVAIKRLVPDQQHGGLRLENVCFVKKSKRFGYRCLLMSEVISQGKVTTSISIQQPRSPPGDPHFHYVTMSDISGPSRASVCSSTLSVPSEHYKHVQRLNVSGGSDVVTFIALAACYDIIVGPLTYWMERKY